MPSFQTLTLAIASINVAALAVSALSTQGYHCDDGRDDTLSSGTYTGMEIEDGCYVNVNDGVSLSGTIEIRDGSKLTIDGASLTNVVVDAQYGSEVSITSSSSQSEISASCRDGSSVTFNGANICNNRRRQSKKIDRRSSEYHCDDGRDDTLSSGTYSGMEIEDGCYVNVNDSVSLSGTINIRDGSRLTVDGASLTNVVVDAQYGSEVSITSSSSQSEISASCQDGSSVTFNGDNICNDRRRRSNNGRFSCEQESHQTVSTGTYSEMFVEDECDVIVNEGVNLSGTIYVEGESKLYITNATLSNVNFWVENESYVSITSSGDQSQEIASVRCEDESNVYLNGQSIC